MSETLSEERTPLEIEMGINTMDLPSATAEANDMTVEKDKVLEGLLDEHGAQQGYVDRIEKALAEYPDVLGFVYDTNTNNFIPARGVQYEWSSAKLAETLRLTKERQSRLQIEIGIKSVEAYREFDKL